MDASIVSEIKTKLANVEGYQIKIELEIDDIKNLISEFEKSQINNKSDDTIKGLNDAIDVIPYDLENNVYKIVSNNILVSPSGEEEFIYSIGRFENGKVLPLTDDDIRYSLQNGLAVNESYDLSKLK
jgi:hypothetical protein